MRGFVRHVDLQEVRLDVAITATVQVQVRTSGGTVTTATDTVRLAVACGTAGSPPPAARIFAGTFE